MTSDVTLTGALNNAQKTQNQSFKLATDFSQFLTLLTTQLQNQDPLNPMDSSEFTNQLVQFSQVEQSINTNQKLDDLVGMQLANLPAFATNYVGMDITYQGTDLPFDGSTPTTINYALDRVAATAKINVYNDQGGLVYSHNISTEAGKNKFVWDGSTNGGTKAPAGTYSVQISAFDSDDASIDSSTAVTGRVHGVETQNGLILLLVGERAVPLGNIINATMPPAAPADDEGGV